MDYQQCVKDFGACGIDCSRCVSRKGGEIQQLSTALKKALTNFEAKAPLFSAFAPALKEYGHFTAVLDFLTEGACEGCRSGQCLSPGCAAKDCHQEMAVDFCAQCPQFPCSRNHFDPVLEAKWLANGNRMKTGGIEAFCEQAKQQPRY